MHVWNDEIDRRSFLRLAGASLGAATFGPAATAPFSLNLSKTPESAFDIAPVIRIEPDARYAQVPFLSWDTEGGTRAQTNLLRLNSPIVLRVRAGGAWKSSGELAARKEEIGGGAISYVFACATDAALRWTVRISKTSFDMTVSGQGRRLQDIDAVEMHFPFDPQVTPTTILPQAWDEDGRGTLPAVISSPISARSCSAERIMASKQGWTATATSTRAIRN